MTPTDSQFCILRLQSFPSQMEGSVIGCNLSFALSDEQCSVYHKNRLISQLFGSRIAKKTSFFDIIAVIFSKSFYDTGYLKAHSRLL
jgi:hypothetical protein